MDQTILAVDDNGKFLEYIPKAVGHKGSGRHHLAIAVLLYDSAGRVLLQKRKHKIFNNIWDMTGATHPLHKCTRHPELVSGSINKMLKQVQHDGKCEDTIDESLEEATKRCLREEWDIRDIRDIRILGEFNYFAKYGEYCENEHCAILVGEYNGPFNLNPKVGYEYKWMDKAEFLDDISQNPQNYTPWTIKGTKILKKVLAG